MPLRILSVLFAVVTFSSGTLATNISEKERDAIVERIKPVGSIYITGAEPIAAAKPTEPRDGSTVYNTYCTACHTTGAAGAPVKGNKDQWAPRIAKGLDVLTSHTLNGFNAMPARGSCMDCSDDELVETIKYLTGM